MTHHLSSLFPQLLSFCVAQPLYQPRLAHWQGILALLSQSRSQPIYSHQLPPQLLRKGKVCKVKCASRRRCHSYSHPTDSADETEADAAGLPAVRPTGPQACCSVCLPCPLITKQTGGTPELPRPQSCLLAALSLFRGNTLLNQTKIHPTQSRQAHARVTPTRMRLPVRNNSRTLAT